MFGSVNLLNPDDNPCSDPLWSHCKNKQEQNYFIAFVQTLAVALNPKSLNPKQNHKTLSPKPLSPKPQASETFGRAPPPAQKKTLAMNPEPLNLNCQESSPPPEPATPHRPTSAASVSGASVRASGGVWGFD